ncbi:STAS-like domain-containing protein [Brevundimonas sp.]|uniref:STAS-like domain-containing protein n=1 Tax=Brevundimonas sp. TaxID=1871086 RepID=UPI00272FC97D|nr:DUF4325 domain-containing protein [Brevundimonas sp.]MDP1912192.1 DUF4325 domain-containing protein [Brevundimonas sp.]
MARPLLLPMNAVRRWATAQVAAHPKDFTGALARSFGVTRSAAAPVVRQLVSEAFVLRTGGATRPVFAPGPSRWIEAELPLAGLDESAVWEQHLAPWLSLPANVENALHYGVTEMVNNACDHSAGQRLRLSCAVAGGVVYITIGDDGVGIFERVSRAFGLADRRLALLELAKGRVTTDPARHSGEGIFFTSRAFSVFRLEANGLVYERRNPEPGQPESERLIELPGAAPEAAPMQGTTVRMAMRTHSRVVLRELFEHYTTGAPDDLTFDRTVVPVRLARLGRENLLSRSQARRVISGIDRFKVVELDFEGVPEIGQAFADELFRVFAAAHPGIELWPTNAGPGVLPMIRRVTGR